MPLNAQKICNATLPFVKSLLWLTTGEDSLVFKGTMKNCSVQPIYLPESGILSTGFLFDRLLFVKDQRKQEIEVGNGR